MAIAKVHWKKEVYRGVPHFRITAMEGFAQSLDLPLTYMGCAPRMYDDTTPFDACACVVTIELTAAQAEEGDNVGISFTNITVPEPRKVRVFTGQLLTRQQMAFILGRMRQCGARLAGINKSLSKRNADWHGEGVEEI